MKYLLTFALLKLLLIPQIGYALDFRCMDAEWVNVSISSGTPTYNDTTIPLPNFVNEVISHIEGTFGAVVMFGSGLLALLFAGCAAVGKRRRRCLIGALVLLILAVGVFALRSFIEKAFTDVKTDGSYYQAGV